MFSQHATDKAFTSGPGRAPICDCHGHRKLGCFERLDLQERFETLFFSAPETVIAYL